MPKGICRKCGREWYGWALKYDEYRTCECGGEIEIMQNGHAKIGSMGNLDYDLANAYYDDVAKQKKPATRNKAGQPNE